MLLYKPLFPVNNRLYKCNRDKMLVYRACSPRDLSPDFFALYTQFMCHHDLSCLHVPIPPFEDQEAVVQNFRGIMSMTDITDVESVVLSMLIRHEYDQLDNFLLTVHAYRELHAVIKEYVDNVASNMQ